MAGRNDAAKLNLVVSDMNGEMVVETPAKGSVTTSRVFEMSSVYVWSQF